jgi:3-hydroxyisobutyrate dehydrogenase-like beta-hydroxyacid dehydrogenase
MPTIAVIAPGAMGSAIGRRLTENGATVLTLTDGRSEQTKARARAADMVSASLSDIAESDVILSIVPPAQAVSFAETLAPALRASKAKPALVDMNAINPETMKKVAKAIDGTGCDVIDGSIIGGPPVPGSIGPVLYISGDPNHRADIIGKLGLRLRRIEKPVGAASAFKMVYGGMNKGTIALQAAMLLVAERAGCGESLRDELADSQPQALARMTRAIPDMYPKAYRWVAEMREIAEFLRPDDPASKIFEANARIFEAIADDQKSDRKLAKTLDGLLENKKSARAKAG